jgi:alpha-amylase/alpha-mannosidase (GH57 family)
MKKFICIHGHFYQPPRENPWTGEVDEEPSAAPFHDWNERIAKECYEANTRVPILNTRGETAAFVNNYEHISFDMGPTLLSWMKRKSPVAYRAILEADRKSMAQFGGHGNAMAQIYNHVIMPLAKKRDKITQIVWGIKDFEFHYGRKPEGMWLSETAVDRESLKLMADQGILYTVLASHQAARVRRIGFARPWEVMHHESIHTRRAYRVLLEGGKQFHIFFYDAPVSRAIAFQGLLNSGDDLVHRLMNDFGHGDAWQLVSTATDGESFGHHHRFGEMAIAYALKKINDQKTAHMTNYAEFLSKFGSQWEVDIQERSSWSCAHGVERWRADCGCRINRQAGWNQAWRAVLRQTFDVLQEAADQVFESQTRTILKDPWQARNDYIQVMLDPSDTKKKYFLSKHGKKTLSAADEKKIWDLLEAQKFALFMYTSCGWFFDDISGIEPVQVMKFALRAIELIQPYHERNLESAFVEMIGKAKSNIPENGTGADVFERMVKPAKLGVSSSQLSL